jgi:hypothetical protein
MILSFLFILPHIGQRDQQPAEEDYSHEGSRGQVPQHSSETEGRNERTVNGMFIALTSNSPSS